MNNWEPKLGETYYFVTHWLRVSKSSWASWSGEKRLLEEGNCFRTKQEAEAKLEKIKAIFKDQQITEQNPKLTKEKPKLTVEVFDREDCPEWAKWAAVDADGEAFYYSSEPKLDHGVWICPTLARVEFIPGSYDSKDWKHSLIERPKKCKPLPDWVTVGAPCYDTSNGVFKKLTETDLENIDELKQIIDCGIYREARYDVLSTDKLEALIGKVLQHKSGNKALVCSYKEEANLVYMGHYAVTPEELMTSWTIDGKPCYTMSYRSKNGERWLEP